MRSAMMFAVGAWMFWVPLHAAEPVVVERPIWKVGDSWQFRYTDKRTGAVTPRKHWIEEVRASGGYVLRYGNGQAQKRNAEFQLEPDAGLEYMTGWYRWPLRVGDRWTWDAPARMEAGNGTWTSSREAIAMEWIDVPAGRFECMKVVGSVTRNAIDVRQTARSNYSFTLDSTTWWCPSIRYFAREVEVWRDGYGGYRETEMVLVSYSLAP